MPLRMCAEISLCLRSEKSIANTRVYHPTCFAKLQAILSWLLVLAPGMVCVSAVSPPIYRPAAGPYNWQKNPPLAWFLCARPSMFSSNKMNARTKQYCGWIRTRAGSALLRRDMRPEVCLIINTNSADWSVIPLFCILFYCIIF